MAGSVSGWEKKVELEMEASKRATHAASPAQLLFNEDTHTHIRSNTPEHMLFNGLVCLT